jgi:hypothetical protein
MGRTVAVRRFAPDIPRFGIAVSAARLRVVPVPIDSAAMSLRRERLSQPGAVRPDTLADRGGVMA